MNESYLNNFSMCVVLRHASDRHEQDQTRVVASACPYIRVADDTLHDDDVVIVATMKQRRTRTTGA
jgi:hypothetical protein